MLEEIAKSVVPELRGRYMGLLRIGFTGMIGFLFTTSNVQGQCTITPSIVSQSGSGNYCPDSSFTISVGAFNNQTYTFFHNGLPIPGYTQVSNIISGLPLISYTVASISPSDAGSYSVITYDTCADGNSVPLDTVVVYYEGITALTIDQIKDTSVNFHWAAGPPGSTYTWAIDSTNTFPTSNDSLFSGNTTDTFTTTSSLKGGTKYYAFVTIKNANCSPTPVWVSNSFTTPAACTVNFDSLPAISSTNTSFTICPNGKIILQSNSATGNQWFRDGVIIPDSVGSTFTATDSGAYSITVTDSLGCHASSAPKMVMIASAPATPTITASGPLTFCAGDSVVLSSSLSNSYVWLDNDSAIGQINQNLKVTSSGSYTVQVTNLSGCSATSAATIVNVNALPPVPTITPSGALTFCAGDSVVLSSSLSNSYVWLDNDSAIGQINQTLKVTSSGSYTVQVTNLSGCSATSTATIVNVNALPPVPTITPSGPLTFCAGGDVVLSSTSGNSYIWYKNDTAIGQTSQNITVNSSGSYTVKIININGCSSTSVPTVVNVNALPATPIITPSGGLTFCTGGNVVLSSTLASSYVWYKNDTATGQISQNITVTNSGNYTVQVTNANGCSATSAPTIVDVNALPPTPTITPLGALTFCTGGSVVLSASIGISYIWYRNDTAIGQTTQDLTVISSGSYTVQVTSSGGCAATSNPTVVNVNGLPAIPTITSSGVLTFCTGGNVVLNSSAGISYLWYRNDTATGQTTQGITVSISGSYTVQVTSSGGCSATSNPTIVTVDALPATPTISASGALNFCTGGSVVLNSSSGNSYSWFNNDIALGQINQSLTVSASGSYTVEVTDASGCSATSNPTIVSVSGIPPTPTITASGPLTFCAGGSVVLSSTSGNSYLWFINDTALGQTNQDLTAINSGSYTVQVTSSGGCSATSIPTIVDVNPMAAPPSITPLGSLTFCAGGSVVLSSSAGNSYAWYRNDTAIGQFLQDLTVASSGTYSVQVTSSGGCLAASNPVTIAVNPLPAIPTITGRTILNSCSGDADTLLSSALAGNQWLSNNVPISGETNTYLIIHSAGNYSVQVTNAGQCMSVSSSTSVTAIGSSPQPTISPSGTVTICAGDSTLLTSSLPSGNQWYKDGVPLTGDTLQNLYVSASGNYSVFGGNGLCASQSLSTIVSSSGLQGTPKIVVTGSLTICQGGTVLLQSSDSTENQWYFNGQALFGENSPSYTASAPGHYIVAIGTGACQVFSTAAIVNVVANPPVPVISYNSTNLCTGTVILQSSSDSGNIWYLDTVAIAGAIGKTYSPIAAGNYTVMVSFGSNCTSISEAVNITGASGVTPLIKVTNGVLSSDSLSGNQWYLNDSLIPGATHETYTPKVPGSYTLQFNHNGCLSDFSAPQVLSAGDLTTPNVLIYPIPATDHLTIVNKGANPILLQMYDMAGRRIITIESIVGTYQLPISQLSRGPYYIFITDEKTKNKTRQLILKL